MATTQAFRTALHIPFADPLIDQVVQTSSAGDLYQSTWANGAAGGSFPTPASAGQTLVSGPGPGFAWTLMTFDVGTY